MRNKSKSAMFSMSSLLEPRSRIQPKILDAHCIPHCVIKKGRHHGARHGKTEAQKRYHIAFNARKRCCKRVDSQGEHFKGIHDRFLRDRVYRDSQLVIPWTEQMCIEMDELAKQNRTCRLSKEEFKRCQGQWYLTLNKSGKHAPMRLRPDYRAAVSQKTVFIVSQVRKLQNQYLHNNTGDGTRLRAIPGGTRPKAGGAHDIFKRSLHSLLLQLVSFTVGGDPL